MTTVAARLALLAAVAVALAPRPAAASSCQYKVGNFTFDFSSLNAPGGYNVTDKDGYTYRASLCPGAPIGGSGKCAAQDGVMCQFEASTRAFVAVIAKDTDAPSVLNTTHGVRLGWKNGDGCFPFGTPRSLQVDYVCSGEKLGALSVTSKGCDYSLVVPTSLACTGPAPPPPTPCGASKEVGGKTFIFDAVTTATVTADSPDGQYAYAVQPCPGCQVDSGYAQCASSGGVVCQYSATGSFFATVAKKGGATWSLSAAGNPVASYANGDACFPSSNPRTATIEYVCAANSTDSVAVSSQVNSCAYAVTVKTSAVCSS